MLETVDLGQELSKEAYKARLEPLQARLYALEWTCWKSGLPVMLVFEGWGGTGKGELIKVLTEKLDPRGYIVHPVVPPNTEETMKPWMARFWKIAPPKGTVAIYDRSWYARPLWGALSRDISRKERIQAIEDIKDFEAMLQHGGTLILKFWLHVSKKRQAKTLSKLEKDPLEAWKVSKEDWWQNKHYDKVATAVEEVLDQTSFEHARWHVVEMEDKHFGRIRALELVADALTETLRKKGIKLPPEATRGLPAKRRSK